MRQIDLLVIAPSLRLHSIATRHVGDLPPAPRAMLCGVGAPAKAAKAADVKGAALVASYLLFEPGYTRELMALGHADAHRQQAEICRFFDWRDPAPGQATPVQPSERRIDPLRLR